MRKLLTSLGFAGGLILLIPYTAVAVGLLCVTVVADQVCDLIDRR